MKLKFLILFLLISLNFKFSYSQIYGVNDIVEIDEIVYNKKNSTPLTGNFVEFYEDKKSRGKQGQYINGYLEGNWIWYYKDGKKKRESEYVKSKKTGKTIYWLKDGTLQSECNYNNDKLDGKAVWYHTNGKKKKTAIYKDGVFVGGTVWDEDGNMIENSFSLE